MSLHAAILESSHEVLKELLAPELAERLSQHIMERVEPKLEAALVEFLGMELGRDGAVKKRAPKAKAAKSKVQEPELDNELVTNDAAAESLEALS